MSRRLMLISMVSLVLLIVLGNAFVANGLITQDLIVSVKKDPAGGFTNADLNGRYWFRRLELENFEAINMEAFIAYGYIDFDGNGSWEGSHTSFNSDGSTDTGSLSGTYEVNTDGSFEFRVLFSGTPLPPDLVGILIGHISIDDDRSFAILSQGQIQGEDIQQAIVICVKEPDSPLTLADLNGTWQCIILQVQDFEEINRECKSRTATFTFNNGIWSATIDSLKSDGTKEIATAGGTYLINGNTFDFFIPNDPNIIFSAYLSIDYKTLIISRGAVGTQDGDIEQFIGIALKETTKTLTHAELSGTYFTHIMNMHDFEANDREAEIVWGSSVFDGVGKITFTGQNFDSKGESASGTIVGTWSINPDGSFTSVMASETPSTNYGFISSDNNISISNKVQQTIISSPPDKPTLLSPANGASGVSLTPTLQTGSFSDPDSGDTHLQTEWQISTVNNFSPNLIHITSAVHLTSLTVPHLTLDKGTAYYWRVRFYDNNSNASLWSDTYAFTTLTTTNDQNENGIPDEQENSTVDLDNDGTPDTQQDDIKSLNTVIGDGQMGVSRKDSPNVTSIESIESINPETISGIARPYSMPLGLFALSLNVANEGDTAQVTVYFSEAAPINASWYIYDSIDEWQDYSDHATFSTDRMSVLLELQDGGFGDVDGSVNGVIVDPGGFGLASWIEGYVTDASTGQVVTSAVISILDLTIKTMSDGYYLSMILPGTYSSTVSADGYQAKSQQVVVDEGGIENVDFALTACGFGSEMIYFPHIASDGTWETEICVINTSSQESLCGELKAYNDSGQVVDSKPISLSPNARREIVVGNEFSSASQIGYIVLGSDSQTAKGYLKFYIDGKYRVAIPVASNVNAGDIYISHIASDNNWTTGISLLNTKSSSKTLDIEFGNGTTKTLTIAGNQHQAHTISGLFDGQSQPNINSAVIKNGSGIVGLEIFGTTESSGLSYLSGILLKDDTTSTIHYPHIANDATWSTGIVAYNPSDTSCDVTITPYDQNGIPLSIKSLSIGGRQKYIGTVDSLDLPDGAAWFSIDAASPITGFELFSTKDGKLLGGYTGVGISGTGGVFAKIDRDGTGVAFVNIEDSAATVTMTAYDDNGSIVATETVNLNAHEKKVDVPSRLFTADISTATYIAYSSTGNVVGFQLNVSSDGMMLDALPGM